MGVVNFNCEDVSARVCLWKCCFAYRLTTLFFPFCLLSKEGLNDVILYHQPDDKKKNRGFCFLEYEDHKTAAQARRRLMSGKVKVWGNPVTVEWADPVEEPDPEIMSKVSVGCRAAQYVCRSICEENVAIFMNKIFF